MTKLYASGSGASSQDISCVPVQEEIVIEPYDRLLRDIRQELNEFPVGETVLVGNCPPDVSDGEIHSFFQGFATAVRLKKVSTKTLTTTLYIAKFDSAESASRSKVLHTLSLKEKKILLLQLEDRQLFGKNHVVELNGFQDHSEEAIYDHMSAFGQVNFILKTKSAAYVVYEEASSVEASSRCEYLDQYPVTIRSVLDTTTGSGTSASASGIESCILEQLDQHGSLLVEEDEGQINNFMQLLDMDNLDEYMEMNEREKLIVVDKPLLEVGNEEIIANDDAEEEDAASVADVAAIERQAFVKAIEPKRKEFVYDGCVLIDDRSALRLKLKGNLLRLSNLPQLRVRVQKAVADRKKKGPSTPSKKSEKNDCGDDSKSEHKSSGESKSEHKGSGDLKSEHKSSAGVSKKSKKNKRPKEHSDGAKKEKSEKTMSNDDSVKTGKHREITPAKKSSKDKPPKEERTKSNDFAAKVEPEPGNLKSKEESLPKKFSKEQPKKDRAESGPSSDVVVKGESDQATDATFDTEQLPLAVTTAKPVLGSVDQDPPKQRNPVVILKRLTVEQLEDLSIVRRESVTATALVIKEEKEQPKERKHEKSGEDKRRREKEKRKRSKHSGESGDAKKRKHDEGSSFKESEKKKSDQPVLEGQKSEPVAKEEVVPAETPLEAEVPIVVEESVSATDVIAKPDLSLLSDDEEQRLMIDLPQEAKLEVEKPTKPVVQPDPIKPSQQNRVVIKLDTRSAAILHDKVHDSFLLHLDVLSRVLIKLNKISTAGYVLPKPPTKVVKPKSTNESSSRKSPSEIPSKKREEKLHTEKIRKTDLDKIDNKFLPAGSKLKSQAKAKSKHDSSHKKQHHHVPVPELPAELKKSHLNTSFKIPKKNSHSSNPTAHSATKHNRSELECLHRENEERELQRKRFQKEPKRPEDRSRIKKPVALSAEQQRSNTPDFFDPMWDDDGGGGGDASPLPEPEVPPREQENSKKKPYIPGGIDREKDKKGPSFRDIWNLPPEKPKVWDKEPWTNNSGTIDSGEMWSAEERAQQAVPVLPLFVQEEPTHNQRSNTIGAGGRWSPEAGPGRRSQNFRKFSDSATNQGNTLDSGVSWSPGGASPTRPNSSSERRPPRASNNAAVTIADGESWSPEADTSKKITALNLDQRRQPSSRLGRQDEMPRKQPRLESPTPRGGIDTISSGDLWDTEVVGFASKPVLSGPIWESDVKSDRSKENVVPDFLSDPVIRGASHDRGEKSRSSDRFRGGRRSPGTDDRGRRRSRERSGDRKRRRSSCWSPARRERSPDRRPWGRDSPVHRSSLDYRSRDESFNRSPARRPSLDQRSRNRDGRFGRSPYRSPSRRDSLNPSPARRPSVLDRDGRLDRSVDRSPPKRESPERRHWARGISPRRGLSPENRPLRAWSPFGSGIGGAVKRRSRSRSPMRRMFGRGSRSSEEAPRQSPVRRGAARFRSRSRSRDRHDEDQYRKRSRSPPVRHRQQYPRETSRECSRDGSRSGRSGRDDPFSIERNAFSSPSRDLWTEKERQRKPSTDRREPTKRPNDDVEIPYSPSNFLVGEEDNSSSALFETIPLQLPLIAKSSPIKEPEMVQRQQSATEEPPASEEPVTQPQIRVKQEQLLIPQESITMETEPSTATVVGKSANVKLESRLTEPMLPVVAEQRPTGSAKVTDPEPPRPQEEPAPERLSALGHLKQRAERLKKLEMTLARQKLLASMKLQQKETEMVPQTEEQLQRVQVQPQQVQPQQVQPQQVQPQQVQPQQLQPVQVQPQQVQPQQLQPQPEQVVRNIPKVEPVAEQVSMPIVTDIKHEQQPHEVDPSAASLLLETAVSILSNFGHLLPSIAAGPNPAAVPPPPIPTTPSLPPPLPAEAPKPPPPEEPSPEMLLPTAAFLPAAIVHPPTWESSEFAPMPNLGLPPPFNMHPPPQPAMPFEEVDQQRFQDFPMEQEDMNGGPGCYQENNFDDWQSQGQNFDAGDGYEDQSQSFNYNDEPSWERRTPQDNQYFNDGPNSWQEQQQQPNYFNNQNQQQEESLQLLPPEEIQSRRKGSSRQFDGGFGTNQRNRDPRQRFRGNNRGHNNNNAFRDPRRNRGGSIYAGGGGAFSQQQQQQSQQWNRNNSNNFNRGGGGGQFGNPNRNRNNSWKQGNQRRGVGFNNFQHRSQQQQQQQMGDEFLIDGGGDGSNWDDFMQ